MSEIEKRNVPKVGLSIREPWAWAVVRDWKHIENRTWRPGQANKFPFDMVIAASGSKIDLNTESDRILQTIDEGRLQIFDDCNRECITKHSKLFLPGNVLGIVRVVGVVDGTSCFRLEQVRPLIERAGFGEWYAKKESEHGIDPARWAQSGSIWWLLDSPLQFRRVIPHKGALNLWAVKPELGAEIAARLAKADFGCPSELAHAEWVAKRKRTIAAELRARDAEAEAAK